MIQYSNYKRFFVEEGAFSLNDVDYTGYVEVLSGVPYVASPEIYYDRCVDTSASNRQQLEKKATYKTDIYCSNLFYDRIITDNSNLPFSLSDLLFDTNELLNYTVLKDKIQKLNYNILYAYSRCFVVENKLPYSRSVKFACAPAVTDTQLSIVSGFENIPTFSSNINFLNLGEVKGFVAANYLQDDDTSVIFAYTDTNFISLVCNDTSMSIIEVSPFYETNNKQNKLKFSFINGMTRVGNYLFISDTGNNTIIKYDIGGYINDSSVLSNKRTIVEVLGGEGAANDKLGFNEPTIITASNNFLAVYDSKNYIVKIYDLDFNFVTRVGGINLRSDQLLTIEYNKINNLLYIITKASDITKLYIIDDTFVVVETYILSISLADDEVVKNIEFSFNDSNYFYICTTYNVYKCLVNRPQYIVGRYSSGSLFTITSTLTSNSVTTGSLIDIWNFLNVPHAQANFTWDEGLALSDTITSNGKVVNSTIFNDPFRGYRIAPQKTNHDKVFLFTTGKIYYFKEDNKLGTVLKLDNLENFGGDNYTLSKDEYIQCSTLNKELYKVARDTLNIKNNILGRFAGRYDAYNVFVYSQYNYNINFTTGSADTLENFYIHENEKNILGVFNRAVTELYNLQLELIDLTKPDNGDGVVPVSTMFGDNNNVVIIE